MDNAADALATSPCIRQCCLNEQDVCVGCFRTLAEILAWTQVDSNTRQQYLQNCAQRRQAYRQKYP